MIRKILDIKRRDVYFEVMDGKWHIENSLMAFDSKREAENKADAMYNLSLLTRIAEMMGMDYGFNGEDFTVHIERRL